MWILQVSSPLFRFLGRNSGSAAITREGHNYRGPRTTQGHWWVEAVLGFVGFYRKFIPFFADVMTYLNTLLRKGAVFKWTEQCGNAFSLLKLELVKIPKLQYPNPNKPFMLFIDASKHNSSGILHQEETQHHPGEEVSLIPIAYFLGLFSRTQQLWTQPKRSVMQCKGPFKSLLFT